MIIQKNSNTILNNSSFELQGYSNNHGLSFWKIKKFTCKSLKNRGVKSGIRLIYSLHTPEQKVHFLEIYYKSEKENENSNRIKKFIANFNFNNYEHNNK